jgi:hypothetical protein
MKFFIKITIELEQIFKYKVKIHKTRRSLI